MTAVFRGTVVASAVVLDPKLIGVTEARRRAVEVTAGSLDVRVLPDERWLAMLPAPLEQRCEFAPGLMLIGVNGGLAMPGLTAKPSGVTWQAGSIVHTAELASLPRLPTHTWLDISAPVHRLEPADAAEPLAVRPVELTAPAPDLRAKARIGRPRARRRARLARQQRHPRLRRAVFTTTTVLVVFTVAGLVVGLVSLASGGSGSGFPAGPVALVLIYALSRLVRRGAAAKTGAGTARPSRFSRWLQRLISGPARNALSRQHERYLRSLTTKFQRRDWQAALREAIGLAEVGGQGGGWLRLRMPKPRQNLQYQLTKQPGGSVPMGDTAFTYLRAMYAQAAAQLESAQLIDEAAFVHAELLNDVSAAVTLLERQGRLRLAAELAEARRLAPELVVRLWWRAGDRDRAIAFARARGAFAAAIPRLAQVDEPAARELRTAWVTSCQQAGDHLGAVAAAWPEPTLRSAVLPDIEAGMTLGGALSGALFAHLLSEHPTASATQHALALLRSRNRELHRARTAFIATYAGLDSRDAATDRQVCTAAVRSAYALDLTAQLRTQIKQLAKRADPLLNSDLPPIRVAQPRAGDPLELDAPDTAGQLPVHDAVTLPGRALLVAHGDTGVRLLTLDGRTRNRWDVPTHQIVLADNFASALLLRNAGGLCEVSRLDLVTRRVQTWSVLRHHRMLSSFDGGSAVIIDADGIALLDVLGNRPRILWRELDRNHRVLRIGRVASELTALIEVPPTTGQRGPTLQLWSWELPSMTLRTRRHIDQTPDIIDAAVCAGSVVLQTAGSAGDPKLSYIRGYKNPIITTAAPDTLITASGDAFVVEHRLTERWMCTVDLGARPAAIHATFPAGEQPINVREHAGIITLWDDAGRIVAGEPGSGGALAALTTRV